MALGLRGPWPDSRRISSLMGHGTIRMLKKRVKETKINSNSVLPNSVWHIPHTHTEVSRAVV